MSSKGLALKAELSKAPYRTLVFRNSVSRGERRRTHTVGGINQSEFFGVRAAM